MKRNIAIMSWSLNNGGAERAAANLSKDLSDKYNVYIILFDSRNITYPYEGKILDLGYKIPKSKFGKFINMVKRCIKIKEFKKIYNIDTVISFMPQVNLYNILTKTKSKAIVSIRNNMSKKGVSKISKKLIKYVGKKADVTISLSEGVKADLIENFSYPEDKIVTIYNSCDISWFLRENIEIDNYINNFDFSSPIIVSVGRLTYQKGQWHLLRAFRKVLEEVPNCKLVVFGEGEYRNKLELYASKLGIDKNVYFPGYIKNHHKFLLKSDIFVFPSLFEGLGNVLLEALACELPIISTNCFNGPSEILDCISEVVALDDFYNAKYGILTPTFSNKQFDINDFENEKADLIMGKAIIKLLKDEKLRAFYKEQAKKRKEDFLPKNIINKWIEVIEDKHEFKK